MATSRRLFRNNLCEKREGERKKTPDHEKEVDEKDVNTDANTNTKQDLAMKRKSMRKMAAVTRLRITRTGTAPSCEKEELLCDPIRDF